MEFENFIFQAWNLIAGPCKSWKNSFSFYPNDLVNTKILDSVDSSRLGDGCYSFISISDWES